MATGRIGVTPTLRTRWSKQPSAGTTSLSGLDDNSVALVYDVGYEAVYRNGTLLSRGNDYTATNGTTVTLIDATLAGDIIEILANQLVPLTNAISNGQFTAKGALLSATAASTPGVLTVGSNDQVLTADSTTSTGLKWATPAAGGMTLISTTTLTGSSVSITSIPQTYKHLFCVYNAAGSSSGPLFLKINNNSNYYNYSASLITGGAFTDGTSGSGGSEGLVIMQVGSNLNGTTWIPNYTTSDVKFQNTAGSRDNRQILSTGYWNDSAAITSLQYQSGGSLSGKVYLYGVS